jgi:uncharacterized protein
MTGHSSADNLFQRHAALLCRQTLSEIRAQFRLDWWGYHGVEHWSRVLENGLTLCGEMSAARPDVVVLFALFHDACRENEYTDPEHGHRAAKLAVRYHQRGALSVDATGLQLLVDACTGHDKGSLSLEPTIGVCWDADRLDLGRVGIRPAPMFLSTAAARQPEMLEKCVNASRRGEFPRRMSWVTPLPC